MRGRSTYPVSWLDDLKRRGQRGRSSRLFPWVVLLDFLIDTNAIAMIRSGNSVRFTPNVVEEFRQVGLDLSDVECQNDIEQKR